MDFEDRRGQLLQILPKEIRRDVFRRLNEFRDLGSLKEWIREQLELERNWSETDQAGRPKTVGLMEDDLQDNGGEEPEESDMDALLALTTASSQAEIHAVQQRFRRFAKGSGRGGRPTSGKGTRT